METYLEFCSPPPTAAYMQSYLSSLTFDTIVDLTYPIIASYTPRARFSFVDTILTDAAATLVLPGEVIPSKIDLDAISHEMPHAFEQGMRSVSVEFTHDGSSVCRRYHFSKIQLLLAVTRYSNVVYKAQHLGSHVENLLLEPPNAGFLSSWKQMKITAPLAGLSSAQLPLWKLSDLLDEIYPDEELMSALAEVVYFAHAISPHSPAPIPSHLYMPVRFLADARLLFNQGAPTLSPQLDGFRQRLIGGHISVIAFLDCTSNHYSAYVLTREQLAHRDSLGHAAEHDVLPILTWLIDGTGFPLPTEVFEEVSLPLQSHSGVSSGSCGLAAHDYIMSYFNDVGRSNSLRWTSNTSPSFRNEALLQLIRYHMVSSRPLYPLLKTTRQLVNTSHVAPIDFCGYADFNVVAPLECHPIYEMMRQYNRPAPSSCNGGNGQLMAKQPSVPSTPTILPLELLPSLAVGEDRITPIMEEHLPVTPTLSPVKLEVSPVRILPHDVKPKGLDTSTLKKNIAMKRPRSESVEISEVKSVITILDSPPCIKKSRSPSILPLPPPIKKSRSRSPSIELVELSSNQTPRTQQTLNELPRLNSFFKTDVDAFEAISAYQESLGFKWIRAQSKTRNGAVVRLIFRCNRQSLPASKHSPFIDPSDHREGKSARTGCRARVNLCKNPGGWHITLLEFDHNHERSIPIGGAVARPPTLEQRKIVAELAAVPNITRNQVSKIVQTRPEFKKQLEPRQLSNILTQARRTAREEVRELGGDFSSILATLKEKAETSGWYYDALLDPAGTVVAVFWQSDVQVELGRRYGDILVNDNSYNRNDCGYILNIGITPDGFNTSRNVFYALHAQEDQATLSWVLRSYVTSTRCTPETTITDKDSALIRVIPDVYPTANYVYCLYHAQGNVALHARRHLGGNSDSFMDAFWTTYRAVSPEDFDQKWSQLIQDFPPMSEYMQQEWYPCRQRWAWAWISTIFTAGMRTTGRVEAENRITKASVGAKTSGRQLFDFLNERTSDQRVSDLVRVRDSSRRQHEREIEKIYVGPLALLREYAGPFALQTCYKQMELSLTYRTEAVPRPHGLSTWSEYAIAVEKEVGFHWLPGEEKSAVNDFSNDNAYISTKWLIRLINRRGHVIQHLFRVTKLGSSTVHYIAVLPNMEYVCDCCMGLNLGLPCRHYFQLLLKVPEMKFHIGLIRARWLQDPSLDTSKVPSVTLELKNALPKADSSQSAVPGQRAPLTVINRGPAPSANPLDRPSIRPTETVPARTVFHKTSAKLKSLANGIQTQEDLDGLLDDLDDLQQQRVRELHNQTLREPPVLKPKGRPRQQRLTGALEGRPRGGGGAGYKAAYRGRPSNQQTRGNAQANRSGGRNCGVCRQPGHNRKNCPLLQEAYPQARPSNAGIDDDIDNDNNDDDDIE